jgi:hypothetical protein
MVVSQPSTLNLPLPIDVLVLFLTVEGFRNVILPEHAPNKVNGSNPLLRGPELGNSNCSLVGRAEGVQSTCP